MVVDLAAHPAGAPGEAKRADRVFRALGDATRRDIVMRVLEVEHSVSELARNYPMTFAAVQKHVAVLEAAELVTKRRHGREQLVRGNPATLQDASRLLDRLETQWRERLARFGDVLADEQSTDPAPTGPAPTGPAQGDSR